ncbi:MAG: hypothetical protein AB8B64_05810 [Granulosicoccus sp.]
MYKLVTTFIGTRILSFAVFFLVLGVTSMSFAWSPNNGWRDSYAVNGQCYCDSSNFDHQLDTKSARTPQGVKNVVTICEDIENVLGSGPDEGRIPYNDIQCGNGPVNNADDETGCPGRVDQGESGCMSIGPRWNLEDIYGAWPENCTATHRLLQNTWYMFSMPCDVQLPGKNSVAEVLGDDLGINAIGLSWKIFALQDNGLYAELGLTDELKSGVGYWLLTTQSGVTVDVSGEYPIEVDISLRSESVSGAWTLVGSPFRYAVSWADASVINSSTGKLVSLTSDDSSEAACGRVPLSSDCTVSNVAYKWTESGAYEALNMSSGSLDSFEGAWVRAGASGMRLRLPRPAEEVESREPSMTVR